MRPRELIEEDGTRVDIKILEVLLDLREALNRLVTLQKESGSRVIPKNPVINKKLGEK